MAKIAVLDWGFLIWDRRNLRIAEEWNGNGNYLPIEFARISLDERLTLVLYPNANEVQVLWAFMNTPDIDIAIENLRERKGTSTERIGFVDLNSGETRCNIVKDKWRHIKSWLEDTGIEKVIWVDLKPKFKCKSGMDFNASTVIKYLQNLPAETKIKAEEYIRKTPPQISTKLREGIAKELKWIYESS